MQLKYRYMKQVFVLIFCLSLIISCKAQEREMRLSYEQSEVLKVFLRQQELYSYIDKHLSYENRIGLFTGRYRQNRKFYRVADSVCTISSDTLKLKIYCPLADAFKKYSNLLNENDLLFMLETYDIEKKRAPIFLDSLIFETTLKEHSKEYYEQIVYDKYDGIPDLKEFPSIRIDNIYFNKGKNVAIIAYKYIYEQINSSTSGFYLLKKKDDIWWKPLGNLKL